MDSEVIWVEHKQGSYAISFDESECFNRDALHQVIGGASVCIVTNKTVSSLYLEAMLSALSPVKVIVCELPDGESFKTVEHWMTILGSLSEACFDRGDFVLALGGGVIGDMGGFAASVYMRGIRFIQVPTTLLAQVDSSVGGKTGVNLPTGKNLAGAFWQPSLVLINSHILRSLPEREYYSGFAEIIKAALVGDAGLFDYLESEQLALKARAPVQLTALIRSACLVKRELVQADERELSGQRALLNLGHTFGHAIECYMGFGEWLHGEAVAVGIMLALRFACQHGLCENSLLLRTEGLLSAYCLPTSLPLGVDCAKLAAFMSTDKKTHRGALRLVLPHALGRCELTGEYGLEQVQHFLTRLQESA